METVTEKDLDHLKQECEQLYCEHTVFVLSMRLTEIWSEDVAKSLGYKRHLKRVSRRDLGRLWFASIKKAGIPLGHIPMTTAGVLTRKRVYPQVIRRFMEECM